MPRICQRIANELANTKLLLTRDTLLSDSVRLGEKDHCLPLKEKDPFCSSGKMFMKPKVQPVNILALNDGNKSFVTEPEVQPVELLQLDESRKSIDTEPKMELVDETAFEDSFNCIITWDDLNNELKAILPPKSTSTNMSYTYVIEKYEDLTQEAFSGEPKECFNVEFRVNLHSKEEFNDWITAFFQSSQCTYRKTRTYNPSLKRVLYKLDMHCHHYRKQLTAKQLSAKSKKPKKPTMVSTLRNKKTNCPSRLSVTLFATNNKATSLQRSHPLYVKLLFQHNHPIKCFHTLSFKSVSQETKDAYFTLFALGHSAATARHYHESQLLGDPDSTQATLADRSVNPNPQDVSRLFDTWRKSELGLQNGKSMFEKLEEEIRLYNEKYNSIGGKATLQFFDSMKPNDKGESADDGEISDCSDSGKPPKRRKCAIQPMIVTICTPMMTRAHQNLPQAAEVMYCDSTSCLDRFNTSVFLFSTNHAGGSIPLGIALTSDEKESTLCSALSDLKKVWPQDAFYNSGTSVGPKVILTDDSAAEQAALQSVWPSSTLLLCSFHFLQRRWTWLYDGKNKIVQGDRVILINLLKKLLYSKSELLLNESYSDLLKHTTASKYPHFCNYVKALWTKRHQWALCFRVSLPVRGNHTNNYSEAGMKILKELIFSRVKAYNLIQMFHFVTDALELYYQRKLLSIAHCRFDHYVSMKFKGINASKIKLENIYTTDNNDQFKVVSSRDTGDVYTVDMSVGFCTCVLGSDGSPCSHQAAVAINFHKSSINFIPSMHPESRKLMAYIALGEKAEADLSMYAAVSQASDEKTFCDSKRQFPEIEEEESAVIPIVVEDGTCEISEEMQIEEDANVDQNSETLSQLKVVMEDMTKHLQQKDQDYNMVSGIEKFVKRYQDMCASSTTAKLASALHQFAWSPGEKLTVQPGLLRRGYRIPVQATAAGRRQKGTPRGKGTVTSGRPLKLNCTGGKENDTNRYNMPSRREPKGKRPHNFSVNVSKGLQNAGKW